MIINGSADVEKEKKQQHEFKCNYWVTEPKLIISIYIF